MAALCFTRFRRHGIRIDPMLGGLFHGPFRLDRLIPGSQARRARDPEPVRVVESHELTTGKTTCSPRYIRKFVLHTCRVYEQRFSTTRPRDLNAAARQGKLLLQIAVEPGRCQTQKANSSLEWDSQTQAIKTRRNSASTVATRYRYFV